MRLEFLTTISSLLFKSSAVLICILTSVPVFHLIRVCLVSAQVNIEEANIKETIVSIHTFFVRSQFCLKFHVIES